MWGTSLYAVHKPTGQWSTITHSTTQPHAPEQSPHGQAFPVVPADYIGIGSTHPYQLENHVSDWPVNWTIISPQDTYCTPSPSIPAPPRQLNHAPTTRGILLLYCSFKQLVGRWETCLQAACKSPHVLDGIPPRPTLQPNPIHLSILPIVSSLLQPQQITWAQAQTTPDGKSGDWLTSQLDCSKVQSLSKTQGIFCALFRFQHQQEKLTLTHLWWKSPALVQSLTTCRQGERPASILHPNPQQTLDAVHQDSLCCPTPWT